MLYNITEKGSKGRTLILTFLPIEEEGEVPKDSTPLEITYNSEVGLLASEVAFLGIKWNLHKEDRFIQAIIKLKRMQKKPTGRLLDILLAMGKSKVETCFNEKVSQNWKINKLPERVKVA